MKIEPLGEGVGKRMSRHRDAILWAIKSVLPREQRALDITEGVEGNNKYWLNIKWSPKWRTGFIVSVCEDGSVRYFAFGITHPDIPVRGESSLLNFEETVDWVSNVINWWEGGT